MSANATPTANTATDRPAYQVIAGDCLIRLDGSHSRTYRGQVLVLIKPDNTVLVHDADGYQPVAWLTRAESVTTDQDNKLITAVDDDHWLRIEVKQSLVNRRFPASPAGKPVSDCPACNASLIASNGTIQCVGCRDRYGLPEEATLLDDFCDCGLPRMRIERGDTFTLCIDRTCEPMVDAIADRFDGVWSCPAPTCDGDLRIIHRNSLLAGCDTYPDCEVAFRFPAGLVDGHCGCGLPRIANEDDARCLDATCASE